MAQRPGWAGLRAAPRHCMFCAFTPPTRARACWAPGPRRGLAPPPSPKLSGRIEVTAARWHATESLAAPTRDSFAPAPLHAAAGPAAGVGPGRRRPGGRLEGCWCWRWLGGAGIRGRPGSGLPGGRDSACRDIRLGARGVLRQAAGLAGALAQGCSATAGRPYLLGSGRRRLGVVLVLAAGSG